MAFEYAAVLGCPPSKDKSFFENLMKFRHSKAIFEKFQELGKSVQEALSSPFTILKEDTQAIETRRETTVWASIEEMKPFLAVGHTHCARCVLDNGLFGCYGAVNYPISEKGEIWFMRRFMDHADAHLTLLGDIIKNQNVTGQKIAQARLTPTLNSRPLFVRSKPVRVTFETGQRISSDQVFEVLFSMPEWQPHLVLEMLKDFGAVHRDKVHIHGVEFLMEALTGRQLTPEGPLDIGPFTMPDEPDDDESIHQFKQMFGVMYRAAIHRARFLTNA